MVTEASLMEDITNKIRIRWCMNDRYLYMALVIAMIIICAMQHLMEDMQDLYVEFV